MNSRQLSYKPPLSQLDIWLERLINGTFLLVCLILLIPFLAWIHLPERLPIQWNTVGEPIQWTSKIAALFFIIVILISSGFIELLARIYSRNPAHLPKVVKITEENIRRQYRILRTFSYLYMLEANLLQIYAAWNMAQTWFGYLPSNLFLFKVLFGLFFITGLIHVGLSIYKK